MPKDAPTDFPGGAATEVAGDVTTTAGVPDGRSFFGHPRGLATLFFTEMWERFSYYGMRAILILFMTAAVAQGGLGFDVSKAGAIYGLYTAFVYLMALPGGWIADKLLGQRHAVLVGGIIIASGHFSMAVEGMATFYLGLVLIVLGTGLLKPNISAMVGELYPEGGARRDAGFSIFYMGINIGAFVAPLLVGFLGEKVNWHAGFAAAGFGMLLGLVQYVVGGKYLGAAGRYREDAPGDRGRSLRHLWLGAAACAVIVVLVMFAAAGGLIGITAEGLAQAGNAFLAALVFAYFGYMFFAGGLSPDEKKRLGAIGVLFIAAAVFWSGFEQAGSSLNLVAERLTDRTFGGVVAEIAGTLKGTVAAVANVFVDWMPTPVGQSWEMPASWLQSVNALFIIALAPVFAWLWVALGKRDPSSPAKFAIGLVLLGIGFLVLVWATTLSASGQQISPAWLVVTYFFHTTGELALSPVGLSTMTKLAPHRMAGQVMGIWFMATAVGNLIAGQAAGLLESLTPTQLFGVAALSTIGAGVILALFIRPIGSLMKGVR